MSINFQAEENKAERKEANLHHYQKLLAALGGTGEGWHYNGECIDCGSGSSTNTATCVCGHPVRYLFKLEKAGMEGVWVGSVCVETAPDLSKEAVAGVASALAQFREQINADKRKASAAARDAEAVKLIAEIIVLYDAVRALKEAMRTQWVCRAVFDYRFTFPRIWLDETWHFGYKTTAGLLTRLKKERTLLQAVVDASAKEPPRVRYKGSFTPRSNTQS